MSRGESVGGRQDVPSYRVEDAWIFFKNTDVKDLLRVIESEMRELGVETSILRSEIGDAK